MTTYTHPTAFSHHGPEERAAWDRVYASGRFTMGPETAAFEQELADYHGRRFAIAVNSGSSANMVALLALLENNYIDTSSSISVPALAWSTTYSPLVQAGLELVIRDCDDTWNSPVIDDGADHTLVCSILGNPVTSGAIFEDNCEALGARTVGGRKTGTFGVVSTESFFYSHQVSAIELGAVLTDDPELNRLCRLLRNHGNAGDTAGDDFDHRYDFQLFGMNVRPTELHCALARAQLRKLGTFVAARRANDAYFRAQTANLLSVTHPRLTSPHSSPFGLAFRVETPAQRRKLVHNLRGAGIDARPPTGGSFTRHPYGAPWRDQPTPTADLIHDTGLFLGNPPWPAEALIDRAVKVLRETL